MSLPYMGNEYGDAGSGDSCDRSIPRPPVNSEVDVKLRSGAVVVFLQPPEGQGVQEQAGGEFVPCRRDIGRLFNCCFASYHSVFHHLLLPRRIGEECILT